MIEIREVKTKKEQKEFLEFPLKMYKGNPCFVPPLYLDEKKIFNDDYVYYEQADAIYFNAYKDGVMAGRISAIDQKASNEKWGQKRVRFTRFDSIDDEEVSTALFDAATAWGKQRGLTEIVGPLGFSDLEREGLLIYGFDELSTFEEQYNYPYYQKLIENYGFKKEVDWLERKLTRPDVIDGRLERISDMMMKKYELRVGEAKNAKDFVKRYGDQFFEILDKTYENIYGTVPFSAGMKKMMIDNFMLIIDVKYAAVILDKNDKVVCFGIGFPSIAKAVQKSGGRLTLPTIFRLLKALKKPKVIDMALIGVLPEYEKRGIATALIANNLKMFDAYGIGHFETNLNLEDNYQINNMWKNFNNVIHKKRRCYIKEI